MFSIIIPSFNREKQLRNALAELNKQLYKEFEVIVVDDASDSEYDLSLDLYHFELKYFRSNKNLGPSGARNIGVSLARYDWIIFLDDDDYFMPEKLMILRETILNNDIDFIYHRARIFMINEKISYISSQKDIDKIPGEVYQHMLSGNFIGGPPNFAIKKSLFNKLHGFSNNVRAIEDYEFLLRLVRDVSKKRIIFVDNVLTGCNYITKSTSVSKNINNLKQACTYISEKYIRDNREFNLFKINTLLMTAHALLMSLNRKSAFFYFKAGIVMFNIKYIVSGIISFISPVLMIKLRGKV